MARSDPREDGPAFECRPTIADIQRAVAAHFGHPLVDMASERRAGPVAQHRQVAMYLARELTLHSLPVIGKFFGKRDHTTVHHACRVVRQRIAENAELAADVGTLREKLTMPTRQDWRAL